MHSGIMSVKGDDVTDTHILKFLKHNCAVEGFSAGFSVLSSAVKHGHNNGDSCRFATSGTDDALQVSKMLVRTKGHFLTKEVISDAVVAGVTDHVKVLATEGFQNHAFCIAVGETRTLGFHQE